MMYAIGIGGLLVLALLALLPLFVLLFFGEFVLDRIPFGRGARFLLITLKSLRRNLVRTSLTYLAAFVLVAVVIIVWSALFTLDRLMQAKTKDIKVVVRERWQALSQMPWGYAAPLSQGAASSAQDARPQDSMTWQFYMGTTDPAKKVRESIVFFFAVEPSKVLTLFDQIWLDVPVQSRQQSGPKLTQAEEFKTAVHEMERNKRGVILGRKTLDMLHKKVGERFIMTGINPLGIDLEFEIIGAFPQGRYDEMAIMNRDYFNDALDVYPRTHGGVKHPLADHRLGMVWLQVPDQDTFGRVGAQIESSGLFQDPPVKCETLSSAVVTELEGFRDMVWGMRWLLSPAILTTMALVIANAIGISVRERRTEIAVLKVLGFRPGQVLLLVLGEAVLIGAISGVLSTIIVYQGVNRLMDNTDQLLPVYIPDGALWWGPVVGALTAVAGSLAPAWSACKVRVSEVFARIA
jgi:putative ABC transport system permease protein